MKRLEKVGFGEENILLESRPEILQIPSFLEHCRACIEICVSLQTIAILKKIKYFFLKLSQKCFIYRFPVLFNYNAYIV